MAEFNTSIADGIMTVIVPNAKRDELPSFNLSAALALTAVTDSVVFKDVAGNEIDCQGLNLATAGSVVSRPAGAADSVAQTEYFIAGGWHTHRASKYFVSGTSTGVNARVRVLI